jgi:transcriptional regulator with PAS, ATPase and Fis domain
MEDHAKLLREMLSGELGFAGMIGKSRRMLRVYEMIRKVSHSNSPVLLLGDTGTGKELVARAVHFTGLRREKPLVPVDCSSLTTTLIETELFGHVKGAFTGADQSKMGLLHAADKGTIFLDEIGELPMSLQAKLLRTLQEKEIRPVGSTERIPIDVRVIAATNLDLESKVRAGAFREDLYFRLNVIQMRLPALRERKVDIPLLVAYFLAKFSDPRQPVLTISDDALRRLLAHDWPGNVRELENAIECAVALGSECILTANDLVSVPNFTARPHVSLSELLPLAEIERRAVLNALRETGGDKLAAARLLGIGKTTLYRKLKDYEKVATPLGRDTLEEF